MPIYQHSKFSPTQIILSRIAGNIKGPGIPDGTGPMRNSPQCPYNKAEDYPDDLNYPDSQEPPEEVILPENIKWIDSKSRNVGPAHDPYSEETYIIQMKDGSKYELTYNGLGLSRITKNGETIKESYDENDIENTIKEFEQLVGISLNDITNYLGQQEEDPMGPLSRYI